MYAFGHGLSYTTFHYDDLMLEGGETITVSFTVTNTGKRKGVEVPQLYLTEAAGEKRTPAPPILIMPANPPTGATAPDPVPLITPCCA